MTKLCFDDRQLTGRRIIINEYFWAGANSHANTQLDQFFDSLAIWKHARTVKRAFRLRELPGEAKRYLTMTSAFAKAAPHKRISDALRGQLADFEVAESGRLKAERSC